MQVKDIDSSLGTGGCSCLSRPLGQIPTLLARDLATSREVWLGPWLKKSKSLCLAYSTSLFVVQDMFSSGQGIVPCPEIS